MQLDGSHAGSAYHHLRLLKARTPIKVRQTLIQPDGKPTEIHVQNGMCVLVINDFVGAWFDHVESHNRKLLFPTVAKIAGRLNSLLLPALWRQLSRTVFVAWGEHQQWRT